MLNKKILTYLRFLPVQLLIGLLVCTWIPYLFFDWQYSMFGIAKQTTFSVFISTILTVSTIFTLNLIRRFPGINSSLYILPVFFFWFIVIVVVSGLTYLPFSIAYYCISSLCLLSFLFIVNIINRHNTIQTLAYIPVGRATDMPEQVPTAEWLKLDSTNLDQEVNGIVTDLHSYDLTDEWEEFLANKKPNTSNRKI
mgnify:CR=1 FL=1